MDRANVARTLIEMQNHIEDITQATVGSLCSEFQAPGVISGALRASNTEVNLAYEMHKRLAMHLVVVMLNKTYKKAYDKSKKGLDEHLESMDLDSSVNAGERRTLYEDNSFEFSKNKHQNTTGVAIADLLIELAKAGVRQDAVDTAYASALKVKQGKVFYDIEPV